MHVKDIEQPNQHILYREPRKPRLLVYSSAPWKWLRAIVLLGALYGVFLLIVLWSFARLPKLEHLAAAKAIGEDDALDSHLVLKVPNTFEELNKVKDTLRMYKDEFEMDLMLFLCISYVFLQTFMIPGPAILNILFGSLYSVSKSLLIVMAISTVGTTLNFFVIKVALKDALTSLLPKRIGAFQAELSRHQDSLLSYMLFVRLTPILPHWFVSIASPVVGIPYYVFVAATVLGHVPMNLIAIHGGATLSSLHGIQDLYTFKNVMFLICVAVIALIPICWKRIWPYISKKKNSALVI